MSEARIRVRIRVSGHVQGVWFRASAEREAYGLGVAGFARNERDGTVLVEAEGAPAAVEAMVAWCQVGPPRAVVTGVDVEPIPVQGTASFRTA